VWKVSYLDDRADLKGRVAIVVGGGGGLGRAGAGGEVMTGALDARDPDALSSFFAESDARYGGRCDVLVNVVGGTFRRPFAETNPRGWDALIRTNFTWLLHSTQLAVARMRPKGGSIINITSIEAHRAAPGFAVYAAMKAAVTSLTRTLAVELAPENIRVNTIAPDYIATPALASLAEGVSEAMVALQHRISTPMGRVGVYEDAGGCALFLASNLSSFVTGSTLHPDGGAIASSGWFNWPDEGYLNHPPQQILERLLDP